MSSRLQRILLRPVPYVFSDYVGELVARLWSRTLRGELSGEVTDRFLELLLHGMDLAFCLSKGFRRNIKDFDARYVFTTRDGRVGATGTFKRGNMQVDEEALEGWDARIEFKNAAALRNFMLSRDQDILDSILANEVEVDGNFNYVYKFGFMARDLARRLGLG